MNRRALLPKITECVDKQRLKSQMNSARLAWSVYPFAVVCVLSLAHIYLQFQSSDMLMQQGHLQVQHRQLVREQGHLHRDLEAMCNPEQLKEIARRDLQMQEAIVPTQQLIARVPANLVAKYTAPGASEDGTLAVEKIAEEKRRDGLGGVLLTMLDSRSANAAAPLNR